MADIFISYAREDRNWVRALAQALEAEGLSVWWDPNLLPGSRYRETIEKELDQAYASIVVWSEDSIRSDFVRDEAEEARVLNRLVPVLKDAVQPPHGFRQIQTADLSDWRGKRDHPEYMLVVEGLGALAAAKQGGAAVSRPKTKPKPVDFVQAWLEKLKTPAGLAVAGVGILLVIMVAFLLGRSGNDGETAEPNQQQAAITPPNPPTQREAVDPSQMTLAQKVDACVAGGKEVDATIAICTDALQVPNLSSQNTVRMRVDRGIAYNLQHRYQDALNDFNIALDIDPTYQPAIANRGFSYFSLQQYDAATADYNHALRLDPSDSGTHGMRGDLEFKDWQFGPAIADYQQATQLAPGDFLGWKSLCLTRGMANTELTQAESDCNRALEINNSNYSAYDALGLVRLRQINNQGAVEMFNRSLAIQPNIATSLYGRALAEQRLGNTADANRDFAAARAQRNDIDNLFSRMGLAR